MSLAKSLSIFAVVAVSMFSLRSFAQSELRMTCESVNDAYTECDAGVTILNPRLLNVTSSACAFGQTWGYFESKIWVNHGCRGEFAFTSGGHPPYPTPAPTPAPQPGPHDHRDDLSCTWNGVNWQPFHKPTGHFIGMTNYGFENPNDCSMTVELSHENTVCNWDGIGFRGYDTWSNNVVTRFAYPSLQDCYFHSP